MKTYTIAEEEIPHKRAYILIINGRPADTGKFETDDLKRDLKDAINALTNDPTIRGELLRCGEFKDGNNYMLDIDGNPLYEIIPASNLCAWCRCEIVDDPVTSDATGNAEFCSTSDLFEALIQMHEEVKEIIHDPDGDSLLQCPQCGETSYATSDRWRSEGEFVVPDPDGFVFSIMVCPVCGQTSLLVTKTLP
jgi:predicted RNA-binding Zn-ribbon protein involved in translation (DUF1610 family)